jgi:hypothetical protein
LLLGFVFNVTNYFFQTIENPSFLVVGRLQIDPLVWKEIFLDPIEKSSEQKRHFRVLRVAWARRRRRFLGWSGIQEPTNQYFLIYFPKVVSKFLEVWKELALFVADGFKRQGCVS